MNKFIDEGVKAGYEFVVIEPKECYNDSIVAFDGGRLVYDVEKLMNCILKSGVKTLRLGSRRHILYTRGVMAHHYQNLCPIGFILIERGI